MGGSRCGCCSDDAANDKGHCRKRTRSASMRMYPADELGRIAGRPGLNQPRLLLTLSSQGS